MYRLKPDGMGSLPSPAVQQALQSASSTYGVPLSLLTATAKAESGFNPGVTSSAGARGLMQIMPANDVSLGITNPFDPQQSANAGAKYLSQLYAQYGDWGTALIAYNEGPGNLANKGVFPSSRSYAQGILSEAGLPSDVPADSSTGFPEPSPGAVPGYGYDYTAADSTSSSLSGGTIAALSLAGIGLLLWMNT